MFHVQLDIIEHHNQHVHFVHLKQTVPHVVQHQMHVVYVKEDFTPVEVDVNHVQIKDAVNVLQQQDHVQNAVLDIICLEHHV